MLTRADAADAGPSASVSSALPDDSLFRIHFENLPGPAYIWQRAGDDFVLVALNRAAGALPFSRIKDHLGKRVTALQEAGKYDLRRDLELCATRGVVVRREIDYRYINTDVVRRLAGTIVPLSSDTVVLHTDDITEQRRTERALRDSESKYRTIVDTAHEGIWTCDLDSVTTYVNRRAAEMLGYEPDEVLGRAVFDFMDESLHAEALRIRQRRHTGLTEQFEFQMRHRSGRDVWLNVAASPLKDGSGKIVGSLHMLADITARKQAEQAHRESDARLRALLDANPDLVVRVHRDGRYLDFHYNEAGSTRYLPRPPEEFIGRKVDEIFDAEFARQHEYHRLRALATGEVELWEYARPTEGGERYFEARIVKSGDDEVVITIRDITQRVRLEREVIASSERERTRIGHDLHDGLAQLLIGVKLMLEALTEKLGAADSPHRMVAERAATLMTRAIAQTGELAQGLSPIRKGGRLYDALRHLARESQQLFGIPCEVHCSCSEPPGAPNDIATHLYRIAQEAITNAVKHGRAERIEITCARVQQHLVLSIGDDGGGLDCAAGESGGMGMHIMRYRARSIGGELSVASRDGGGTLVQCVCPWPGASNGAATAAQAPPR